MKDFELARALIRALQYGVSELLLKKEALNLLVCFARVSTALAFVEVVQ